MPTTTPYVRLPTAGAEQPSSSSARHRFPSASLASGQTSVRYPRWCFLLYAGSGKVAQTTALALAGAHGITWAESELS